MALQALRGVRRTYAPRMEHTEVERAVRDWLDANSVNPATGVPPDARVSISTTRITPFGRARTDAQPARESWSVTATLYFPEEDVADLHPKIERILDRFREGLDADALAGDGALRLTWRGAGEFPLVHLDAPPGYPSSVDVLLTAIAPA